MRQSTVDDRSEAIDTPRIEAWLARMEVPGSVVAAHLPGLLTALERGRWVDDELICPRRLVRLTPAERRRLESVCCRVIEGIGGRFYHADMVLSVRDGRIHRSLP